MRKLTWMAVIAVLLAGLGYAGWSYWRTKNVSPVQRGWKVADEAGCFTCHGPGGIKGAPDPGYGMDDVPTFSAGVMRMYAESEAEIREWILDGIPRRIKNNPEEMKARTGAAVLMPAWRDVLSAGQVDDLVAFVKATAELDKPPDGPASEGREVAMKRGCFGCHGPQGRGSMPNLRGFKGYIPAWDGADFPELAKDDAEIREWILDGVSKRFAASRGARFFLERQPIKMPAYRAHLSETEVDRLVDFIHWVRQHPY